MPKVKILVYLGAATGGLFGGLGGEICDQLPYVHHAIPSGIAYIGNAFTDQDTVKSSLDYLNGNLDKVGAGLGFVGGFVKSSLTCKH